MEVPYCHHQLARQTPEIDSRIEVETRRYLNKGALAAMMRTGVRNTDAMRFHYQIGTREQRVAWGPSRWLGRVLTAIVAAGLLVAGFLFFTILLIVAAVALGVMAIRWWWLPDDSKPDDNQEERVGRGYRRPKRRASR